VTDILEINDIKVDLISNLKTLKRIKKTLKNLTTMHVTIERSNLIFRKTKKRSKSD